MRHDRLFDGYGMLQIGHGQVREDGRGRTNRAAIADLLCFFGNSCGALDALQS
jgi:hypothetical protein